MKTSKEVKEESVRLFQKHVELKIEAKKLQSAERRKQWAQDKEKEDSKIEDSKSKLAKYYGLARDAKFERAYAIAWEYGHASGFEEVENYFQELVDLIKP